MKNTASPIKIKCDVAAGKSARLNKQTKKHTAGLKVKRHE